MNKEKKKVLIIVGVIIAIIALLAYLLSVMIGDEVEVPSEPVNPVDPSEPTDVLNTEVAKLDDASTFFTIQNLMNDYYNFIFTEDTNRLLQILDPEYIQEYHITANNVYSIIRNDYNTTSYVATDIYYNPNSSVTYYFVTGYLTDVPLMGEDYNYYNSVSYLVIVDESTSRYVLRPINTSNIQDYAENYDIVSRDLSSGNTFRVTTITEESKLTTYLSEFMNLLVYFPDEAYRLLTQEKQQEYGNVNGFIEQIVDIYDDLSTRIFSYGSKEEDDKIIYEIIDDNQNKIMIYEYGINNFRITY